VASARTLDFTRGGARLLVRSPDTVRIVDVSGEAATVSIPASDAHDVAAVGDEVWIVSGSTPTLRRYAISGAPIGEPLALWGAPGAGELIDVPVGDTAAVWTASPPAVIAVDGDRLVTVPIAGEPDCVLPVSAARWVICRRERVALREPSAERWNTAPLGRDTRIVGGSVLLDGRSAALQVLAPPPARGGAPVEQLVVIGLHDPVVQHRLTLAGVDAIRFAPARGFALVCAGGRRLLLLDLRFGRVVKEHREDRDIVDLAIDDAAQQIALRFGDDDDSIVHIPVRELLSAQPPAGDGDKDAPAPPPRPAPAASDVIADASRRVPTDGAGSALPFHQGHTRLASAVALEPRRLPPAMSPAEAAAVLEGYHALIAALAGRAIALAWHEGRLSFPGEGDFPFQPEVQGLLGRSAGRADAVLREADAIAARAAGTVRELSVAADPRMGPLQALATEFELSSLACLILLAVSAPALWGELARLYGILANDDARPLCDELLLCQILAPHAGRHDIARELDRDAPLLEHGLIRASTGALRPFLPLTAEPVVLRLLRNADAEAELDDVRIIEATRTFDDLFIPAAVKDEVARAIAVPSSDGPTRIVIRGRVGTGRHTLLATLAAAAGRRLGVVDATPHSRELAARAEQLRVALLRAHLLGLLPCIDGLETVGSDDHAGRDTLRDVLRRHPGPVAVRLPWDAQPPLPPGFIGIDLPNLSIDQRLTCWTDALEAYGLYVRDASELATRYAVGPGVVARVCEQVAASGVGDLADGQNGPPDVAAPLETAVRQHLASRLGASATRVARLATWSQVVLPTDIQDSVLELIARIKHRRTVYDVWGFDEVLTTSRGVTALFSGGPGTGKTLVASAIANDLGMDLYRVDLSRIMSKWIGETEQNLAKLFDAAEDGHAIILFDEADSLFAKRTEVRTSVDRYANLEVNYLLQRLDTFEGIAILTTNFGTAIDSAFKRRLSFRLTFPFPDEDMREQIWKKHLPDDAPKAGAFDLAGLARRYRLSGGYIRNAAVRAAFLAAEEHSPLTQDHLERAIKAEFREIGKLADSGVLE